MSHASDLIDNFLKEIKKSYPSESGYQYIIEQRLKVGGIDIQPDIQVIDQAGNVICVVEIGYTRPEKLAQYIALKIPDIQWWSKDGEFLNPHEHIHTTEARIIYHDVIPEEAIWREVDLNETNSLICSNCFETQYIIEKSDTYQIPIEQHVEIHYEKDDPKIYERVMNSYLEDAPIFGELWCNGARWFCVWLCDECGYIDFITGDTVEADLIWADFVPNGSSSFSYYDEFLKRHYGELRSAYDRMDMIEQVIRRALYCDLKKKAPFEELQEYISDIYGYEIEYGKLWKVPD